jgi:hypothetical protein
MLGELRPRLFAGAARPAPFDSPGRGAGGPGFAPGFGTDRVVSAARGWRWGTTLGAGRARGGSAPSRDPVRPASNPTARPVGAGSWGSASGASASDLIQRLWDEVRAFMAEEASAQRSDREVVTALDRSTASLLAQAAGGSGVPDWWTELDPEDQLELDPGHGVIEAESLAELAANAHGNPFEMGSPSWEAFGRETGVWVGVPKNAWDRVFGFGLDPDAVDALVEERVRAIEAAWESIGLLDPVPKEQLDWPRYHAQMAGLMAEAFRDGLVRVNQIFASAAAAGGSSGQLGELAEAYGRFENLEIWMQGQAEQMQRGDGTWNQAIWAKLRMGESSYSFSQLVHLASELDEGLYFDQIGSEEARSQGELRTQTSALSVRAALGRTLEDLRDRLRSMDLDVHGDAQKQADRLMRRLFGVWKEMQPELLGLSSDEADQVQAYFQALNQLNLSEALWEDPALRELDLWEPAS